MARRGCQNMTFAPIPLNVPTILDLPSTSSQDNKECEIKPIMTLPKLPLYGPLDIQNYDQFLKDGKIRFYEIYKQPCAKLTTMNDFTNLFILGRGDFSKMIVARWKKEHFVLKIYSKKALVQNDLVRKVFEEKRILQSLDSQFCIRLESLYQDKSNLIFVFPYISGGEIFTHLQRQNRFDEDLSKFYAAQIVLALEYLHNCDLIHRGLKPENLLLDHLGFVKIIDFSYSKIVRTKTYTFCGTPEYIAPEIIAGKGYGKSVDWWAFGILLFELHTGYPPFISPNRKATLKSIADANFTTPSSFSKELDDLISKLLQPNVSKRIGNMKNGVGDIKNHKWFKGTEWMNIANRTIVPQFRPGERKPSLSYPGLVSSNATELEPEDAKDDVYEYFKDF